MTKKNYKNKDKGMMTVEVILSFTLFAVVIAILIYFINIFLVHNKIQYAINSAAHEISGYSYFYEALGLREANQDFVSGWKGDTDKIDDTVTNMVDFLTDITDTYDSIASEYDAGKNAVNQMSEIGNDLSEGNFAELSSDELPDLKSLCTGGQAIVNNVETTGQQLQTTGNKVLDLCKNPKTTFAGIIGIGLIGGQSYIKQLAGAVLAKTLTESFLENGNKTADEYLRSYGVVDGYDGLDFSNSSIFNDSDMRYIDIVVEYDINLGILGVIPKGLIDNPNIHVVQRTTLAGWLGGDDNHVSKYISD